MRYNTFNDAYCHNLADMMQVIETKGLIPSDDLHAEIMPSEDSPGAWDAEIRYNESGDAAFYAENYGSKYDLTADLQQIGIDNKDITEL